MDSGLEREKDIITKRKDSTSLSSNETEAYLAEN